MTWPVGPDGNIYSVAVERIGAFSLTPQGTLRWSKPEPYDAQAPIDYNEIVWGQTAAQLIISDRDSFGLGQTDRTRGQSAYVPLRQLIKAAVIVKRCVYSPCG